jgi:hypothetical protein
MESGGGLDMSDVPRDSTTFKDELARNWLVLLAMIVGGASVWGTTQATVSGLAGKLAEQKTEIAELRQQVVANKYNGDEKLAALQRDVSEVKVSIGRVEATLQLILRQFPPPTSSPLPPGIGRQ